jgi:hypothetical protein
MVIVKYYNIIGEQIERFDSTEDENYKKLLDRLNNCDILYYIESDKHK